MTPPTATEPQLAVVGPGAIGTTCAALAQQAGLRVALCGRTPLERVVLEPDGGAPIEVRGPVLTEPDATAEPVAWVFLTVKAHQTAGAGPWLRALVGPSTVVVVIQNGVEHRERLAAVAPEANVLPAIARFPANAVAPGRIGLHAGANLMVPAGHDAEALRQLLAGAAIKVEVSAAFEVELWRKLCGNVVGALMALTGGRAPIFRRDDLRELGRAVGRECVAVARAAGAELPDGLADAICDQYAHGSPDLVTSIATDREAGRPLEWDALTGAVCRFGRRHGVATPANDIIATLLATASAVAGEQAG